MRTVQFRSVVSVVALAGRLGFVSAQAGPYSNIYSFGDSVSDSGNVALAIGQPSGLRQVVTSNSFIPDHPYHSPCTDHLR